MACLMGSANPNYKHGLSKTPLFRTWSNAKSRCYDENSKPFKDYGGRGITVCAEWRNDFHAFYDWAMESGYKRGLTLDRIDNDKGYSPDNCRWSTVKEQANNRRSCRKIEFCGETKTISEWAESIGVRRDTLERRFLNGWSVEKALTTPSGKYTKRRT